MKQPVAPTDSGMLPLETSVPLLRLEGPETGLWAASLYVDQMPMRETTVHQTVGEALKSAGQFCRPKAIIIDVEVNGISIGRRRVLELMRQADAMAVLVFSTAFPGPR